MEIQGQQESFARFERLREQAAGRNRIAVDPRKNLADVIKRKKMFPAAPESAVQQPSEASGSAGAIHNALRKAGELLMYDSKVGVTSAVSGNKMLGNYVDLVG